jgi:hypothetical protein
MLTLHPDIKMLDETGIGHHLGVWRPIPLAWAVCDPAPDLSTFMAFKRHLPDYAFSDAYRPQWEPLLRNFILDRIGLQAEDGRRIVIKEPGGSHMAEEILGLLPQSRLVFLLRDGRDVVDSWVDAYEPGSWGAEDGAFPVSGTGRLPFIRWQATVWRYRTEAVERAYACHDPERRVLVRYEDLLADPERELTRIHAVIGVESTAEHVRAAVDRHAYANVPAAERGKGRHVRAASPGGWRENLSAEEQQAMLAVLGEKVRELGYEA